MQLKEYRTPGQLIEDLLKDRNWDQEVLALVLGIPRTAISKIVSGKQRVDAALALALSEVFGVPAERFLELQQSYELATARFLEQGDRGRANRATLYGELPITEMIRRGWLNAGTVRDVAKVESELARFFGVKSVAEIEFLPHAAKKTDVEGPVTPAQLAWIYRARQIASEMIVPVYSRPKVLKAVEQLGALLRSAEEIRKVPRILAEAGIRFVLVESLKSAKIDGACFWLNDNAPVICLSLRLDRIDNFWFVLRHEIEHLLRGHGKKAIMFDTELEGEHGGTDAKVSDEERVANEAATEFCVRTTLMDQFIARKAPLFATRDVLGFANTLRVHPGLVIGQLQRRTDRYTLFREHLVKVRSIITPGAMVDGWGDVAPTLV